MEAIRNTNKMASMVEEFELDTSFKYPLLYGSREADSKMFVDTVERMFQQKIDDRIIPSYQIPAFRSHIDEEMKVFQDLQMDGFMLSMSDIVSWCKKEGMAIGTSRGSVGGSRVAYVTDIIDLNPETWNTNFYRFANPDRLEAGDIDIDCVSDDRPKIFQHITEKFGKEKTARVAAFGTLAERATIDVICGALYPKNTQNKGKSGEFYPNFEYFSKIKSEFDSDPEKTREKYPDLFYYYDGLLGTIVSQSVHPAGMVISCGTLDDNYGTFIKDGERCLVLDMDNAHEVNLIKYDLLILKTVQVIRDACRYIGVDYPKTHEINWYDEEVWDNMCLSPAGIFQMESPFAFESLKKFKPKSIFDITLVTACIRPSGTSYRDKLLARIQNVNGSEQLNEILKDNLGYLVYQEDILRFLMEVCGLSGGTADTVRRGIAKKKMAILEKEMPNIVEGYCSNSSKPREEAEVEIAEIINVIEDASAYMFGYNHAIGYSLMSYLCAYYRFHYPLEFLTSFLNNAANNDDIVSGTEYANKIGVKVTMPKWGISRDAYAYDLEKNVIAQGLSSIKYIGKDVSNELFRVAHERDHNTFVDVLYDISKNTSIDIRQVEILIKIDFFSEFGNQRELMAIMDMFYNTFKRGDAKKIKKYIVDDTILEDCVKKYSVGTTKNGDSAANYTLLDIESILQELELKIKSMNMDDVDDITKVRNCHEAMGYVGYVSGKEEDRKKLYILDMHRLNRKSDNKAFGYSIITKSIGSGKESRFTVFNRCFDKNPISVGNIIYCKAFDRDGQYFVLTDYKIIA